jgi:hypothetical protein
VHDSKFLQRKSLGWLQCSRLVADGELITSQARSSLLRCVLPFFSQPKLLTIASERNSTRTHEYGIAAFSRIAMVEELQAGTLVVIPFEAWKVRRSTCIIRIRDAVLTPQAHQFLLVLRAHCSGVFPRSGSPAQ